MQDVSQLGPTKKLLPFWQTHATSKRTARVVKHVNRQSQRLSRRLPRP